jgi:acyl-CoA thioesterase I
VSSKFKRYTLAGLFWLMACVSPGVAHAQKELLILAFGDSLTAGYELPPTDSYPAQLQAALRKAGVAARVHNAGVSGDTTTGGRARLGWVINSLGAKPDLVILGLGANDALRGVNPKQTRANMDAMMAELQKRGVRVLVVGMLASPSMGKAYGQEFNAIFPDLARKYKAPLYPFLLDGVAANPKLNLSDGVHPNKQGVEVMVRRLLPAVRKALGR